MSSSFDAIAQDTIHHVGLLVLELRDVLDQLVRPTFDLDHRSRYPRTLYGFLMNSFSFIDLLSRYEAASSDSRRNQTAQMSAFLVQFLGCTEAAAEMAIKMYRHTLMHGANPRNLKRGDREIAWLLHWGEPWMPRSMNLTTHTSGSLDVIQVSVEALVDSVSNVAKERFGVWRLDPGARDRVEAVEREITTW